MSRIVTGTETIHPTIEQGTVTSSGDNDNTARLRSKGYWTFTNIKFMKPKVIQLHATSNTGKEVMVNLLGYKSNTTTSYLFDLYWYNSGYSFDVSAYLSNLAYIRVVLKYSDGSDITPEEIEDCWITIDYEYEEHWVPGPEGEFPTNVDFPKDIPKEVCKDEFPNALWQREDEQLNDDYPYHNLMKICKISTEEFADSLWRCEDGINDGFPFHIMMKIKEMNPDNLPYALFRCTHGINGDLPYHKLMKLTMEGSFADATNLEEVKVPQSVKSIGPYAFYNTNITEVTISRDCVYFDTSFPPGCVIKFY